MVVVAAWIVWRCGSRLVMLGWSASLLYRYLSLVAAVGGFVVMGRFWSWVGGF